MEVVYFRLEAETGLSLYHKLMEELGYDHSSEQWTPGILAEGTTSQNKERITNILQVRLKQIHYLCYLS